MTSDRRIQRQEEKMIVKLKTPKWMFVCGVALVAAVSACAGQSSQLSGAAVQQQVTTDTQAVAPADQAAASAVMSDTSASANAAAGVAGPIDPLVAPMQASTAQLMKSVVPAMVASAKGRDISILTDRMAYATRGGLTVVNSIVSNYDAITDAQYARGVVVGYVYLMVPANTLTPTNPRLPNSSAAESDSVAPEALLPSAPLPAGYYAVRITSPDAMTGKAEFLDANGRVAFSTTAKSQVPPASSQRINLTIELGDGYLCIDWHGKNKDWWACGGAGPTSPF
jgi:hypothetical protein